VCHWWWWLADWGIPSWFEAKCCSQSEHLSFMYESERERDRNDHLLLTVPVPPLQPIDCISPHPHFVLFCTFPFLCLLLSLIYLERRPEFPN
jgi:hypothetical protein